MDAQKLINQLKREAKAHPAKAALLATMCGVLIYVCAPLFMSSNSAKAMPVAEKTATVGKDTQPTPSSVTTPKAPQPITENQEKRDWQDTAAEIDSDDRMKPAKELGTNRDPFAPPPEPLIAEKKIEPKTKQQTPAAPPKIHFTPGETGLTLSSTLLGSKSRLAMINGKPYHVYDTNRSDNRRSVVPFAIDLHNDESLAASTVTEDNAYFVLVDVQPRSIILWRLGRRYELELPGVTLADHKSSGVRSDQPNPELPASALTP